MSGEGYHLLVALIAIIGIVPVCSYLIPACTPDDISIFWIITFIWFIDAYYKKILGILNATIAADLCIVSFTTAATRWGQMILNQPHTNTDWGFVYSIASLLSLLALYAIALNLARYHPTHLFSLLTSKFISFASPVVVIFIKHQGWIP